jgi:hypothetical protein
VINEASGGPADVSHDSAQHVQALSLPAVKLAGKQGERQVRDAKHRASN